MGTRPPLPASPASPPLPSDNPRSPNRAVGVGDPRMLLPDTQAPASTAGPKRVDGHATHNRPPKPAWQLPPGGPNVRPAPSAHTWGRPHLVLVPPRPGPGPGGAGGAPQPHQGTWGGEGARKRGQREQTAERRDGDGSGGRLSPARRGR